MADEVGRLAVVLDARISQFEAKIAKAEARMARGAGNMTRSAKTAENSFVGMTRQLGGFLGVLSAAALTTGFNRLLTQLDNIGKTADKLGLTTTALQELRSAAEQSGVGVNTLDMAMQRFGRRVAEARQGTGEAKAALAEMGIALTDAEGRARPLEDVLDDVADRMAGMSEQTDRNRLAMKLFDSEGVALVNMLKNGSAGLREMRDAATGVISEDAIRNAEALRTEIDLLVRYIQGTALAVVGSLATVINDVFRLRGPLDNVIKAGPGAMEDFAAGRTPQRAAMPPPAAITRSRAASAAGRAGGASAAASTAQAEAAREAADALRRKADAERMASDAAQAHADAVGSLVENLSRAALTARSGGDFLRQIGGSVLAPILGTVAGNLAGGASLNTAIFGGAGADGRSFTGAIPSISGMLGQQGASPSSTGMIPTPRPVSVVIQTPSPQAFRASRGQISADIARAVGAGSRRL